MPTPGYSAKRIVYLTFPEDYHAVLENFAGMKQKPVEEMLQEAVGCFFATLVKMPVEALKKPEHFALRDFLRDTAEAEEWGI